MITASVIGCYSKSNQTKSNLINAYYEHETLIDSGHADSEDILFGFEGGDIQQIDSAYHMFVNERFDHPTTLNVRFGHWVSLDGEQWKRLQTAYSAKLDTNGHIPNASMYLTDLTFDSKDSLWYLFFIQYKSEPSRKGGWYQRYDGHVVRLRSDIIGINGIYGNFIDPQIVFQLDSAKQWEGLQGITGFSPYQVGGMWYALYGSANTEEVPCAKWRLGLAEADSLTGKWRPVKNLDPLHLPIQAESPKVFTNDGVYYAAIDEISGNENFSLIKSINGVDWTYVSEIEFLEREKWEWNEVRTPIGIFQENKTVFVYFTTYYTTSEFVPIRRFCFSF